MFGSSFSPEYTFNILAISLAYGRAINDSPVYIIASFPFPSLFLSLRCVALTEPGIHLSNGAISKA